jgi:hypothetical protein
VAGEEDAAALPGRGGRGGHSCQHNRKTKTIADLRG